MEDIHDCIGQALSWLNNAESAMSPEMEMQFEKMDGETAKEPAGYIEVCPEMPGYDKLTQAILLLREVQEMYPPLPDDDREPIAPGDYHYFAPNGGHG